MPLIESRTGGVNPLFIPPCDGAQLLSAEESMKLEHGAVESDRVVYEQQIMHTGGRLTYVKWWVSNPNAARQSRTQSGDYPNQSFMKVLIAIVIGFSMYAIGYVGGRDQQLKQPTPICQLPQ